MNTLCEIVGITNDVFGGPMQVKKSYDPEHPGETYVLFVAEIAGDNAEILALEAEWCSRIGKHSSKWDDFRLWVKRKR